MRGTLISFRVNTGWEYELRGYDKHDIIIDVSELRDATILPQREKGVPLYLPQLLESTYEDAEFNFVEGRWKAASQLYLQCLEFACLLLANDGKEDVAAEASAAKIDLTKRINELFESGLIAGSLKDWAHQIRVIGQYHKHRYVESDSGDAADLRDYCEMFLKYTFTVPGQIQMRRDRLKKQA